MHPRNIRYKYYPSFYLSFIKLSSLHLEEDLTVAKKTKNIFDSSPKKGKFLVPVTRYVGFPNSLSEFFH